MKLWYQLRHQLPKEYIYAGSQLVASLTSSGTPTYVHPDQLSARVFTDSTGTKIGERGHLPFGEVRYDTMAADKWKFTTYERDSESGLDYAIFRFDSTRLGRFQSPDPLAGSIRNPQSLNRYAYVLNNPVNLTDPLGLSCTCLQWVEGYGRFWCLQWDCGPGGGGGVRQPLLPPDDGGGGGGDGIKDRLKKILTENPACADLLGGLENALKLVDQMDLRNIDEPGWSSGGT